jgi:competence protein ComEC
VAGVGLCPFVGAEGGGAGAVAAGLVVLAAGWVLARDQPRRGVQVALLAAAAGLAGLTLGDARLSAIDRGAYAAHPGDQAAVRGFVAGVPRRSRGAVEIPLRAPAGRLLVEVPEPVPDLAAGVEVWARGTFQLPEPWRAAWLRRQGIRMVLKARAVAPTGGRRAGPAAVGDRVRARAEAALGRGMGASAAALARGFVLGQDDRIDAGIRQDFRGSGLAHLLAVSGQNVVLLALLATPALAALRLSLRSRLVALLALIVLYVQVTGAGPSIQRAGVMGAAGIVAALAGRRRHSAYAVLLAAFVTLAANPTASADIGWQLSFAAVIGILLWAPGIRDYLIRRFGPGAGSRLLADGVATTIAATLATTPLVAHHFESVPLSAVPANLLALPAVAPVMWLGMLVAAAGQLPGLPVEPVNWLNSLLIGYIAQVASWFSGPGWALAGLHLSGPAAVLTAYAMPLGAWLVARGLARRRRGLGPRRPVGAPRRGHLAAFAALAAALAAWLVPGAAGDPRRTPGLRVQVLDVGQGDAILLDPSDADPLLVDGGPPGGDVGSRLRDAGVERLAAIALTHDQSDHAGGILDLLGSFPAGRLLFADAGRGLLSAAKRAGVSPLEVAEGGEIAAGSLRVEVLWPPRDQAGGDKASLSGDDSNQRSLVLLARWRGFSMLLTGDAEAEAVPIDPGPIDVLKVAHHGSEDAGLDDLLDRSAPRLAVISVGENSYGHPTAATLTTLARHRVHTLRTDREGVVTIDVDAGGWSVTG